MPVSCRLAVLIYSNLSLFDHILPNQRFAKALQKIIHLAIMSWSVGLADAFQELHDLFADKLDATTDKERQDLDNQIDLQKAQVKANDDLQQEIMRYIEPDSPEEILPTSLAALWSRLVI